MNTRNESHSRIPKIQLSLEALSLLSSESMPSPTVKNDINIGSPAQDLPSTSSSPVEMENVANGHIDLIINNLNNGRNGHNLGTFFELMKSELNRLKTFKRESVQWPLPYISPIDLANAGFFYTKQYRVQCAFCRGIVFGWEPRIFLFSFIIISFIIIYMIISMCI